MSTETQPATVQVERSYLVRVVQSYEVPADVVNVPDEGETEVDLYERDDDILAGRLIADGTESVDYDELNLTVHETPQDVTTAGQNAIRQSATNLLEVLDNMVPDSTVHYAVEDARRALRVLQRGVTTVRLVPSTTTEGA
jgi:hypothetical protein